MGRHAVLLAMLLLDVLRESMAGRYGALTQRLASDPGPRGLAVLMGLIGFNAIMQPIKGEGPGLHTVLDVAHHAVGSIGTWAAWSWMNGGSTLLN